MPKLVIAEKPSVARDLARVLGVKNKKDGYMESPDWVISWCIGHLAELCEPHEYNPAWKYWKMATLPMIPQEFRLRPNDKTRKQFYTLKKLLHRRDISSVVNACDAGREGELIFRYVYELAEAKKPVERLWISSMTDEAIAQGFRHLQPGHLYERLWHAARGRSEADWLVGLNATRALTLRIQQVRSSEQGKLLMSVGRVQTPTLAMVVQREIEILHFVPQDYWQLFATFGAEHGTYRGKWFRNTEDSLAQETQSTEQNPKTSRTAMSQEQPSGAKKRRKAGASVKDESLDETNDKGSQSPQEQNKEQQGIIDRFWNEAEAQAMLAQLEGLPAQVKKVDRQTVRERPLLLFDLSGLQRVANRRYGFSAARTLELAQSLYETYKLLTYPRTDSTHLSTDMIGETPKVVQAVSVDPYLPFTQHLLNLPSLPTHSRIYNNGKVSDHHAIIPTPKTPNMSQLPRDEQLIYDLVVRRFLAAFYRDAVIEKTVVITVIGQETFVSRGKVIIDRAWREVIGLPDDPTKSAQRKKSKDTDDTETPVKEDDDEQGLLPPLQEKEHVLVQELVLEQKQTKPPPRYNEASLLTAMEGAGKQLDEQELKQALKDSGLGTPATRASIIETLLSREYMERHKKTLHPTTKGMQLIAAVPIDDLKSAELTGRWEAQLARIARGEEDAQHFYQEVRGYVANLIQFLKQAPLPDLNVFNFQPQPVEESQDESEYPENHGISITKTSARPGKRASSRGRKTSATSISSDSPTSKKKTARGSTSATKTTRAKKTTDPDTQRATRSTPTPRQGRVASTPKEGLPQHSSTARETGISVQSGQRSPHASSSTGSSSVGVEREPIGICPFCREGHMIWGRQAWGCSRWREGCMTTIPYEIAGRKISVEEAQHLLEYGQFGPLVGFRNEHNQSFSGTLRLERGPKQNRVVVDSF